MKINGMKIFNAVGMVVVAGMLVCAAVGFQTLLGTKKAKGPVKLHVVKVVIDQGHNCAYSLLEVDDGRRFWLRTLMGINSRGPVGSTFKMDEEELVKWGIRYP
jgi:hypothetical protein